MDQGANSNTDFGSLASAQQTWFSDVQPGNTGGEYFHTLTTAQTPAHTHTRGTMDITGKVMVWTDYNKGNSAFDTDCAKGAFHFTTGTDLDVGKNSNASNGNYDAQRLVNFTASRTWSGETSSVGGNESHNNMPPYLAVAIWKRTA